MANITFLIGNGLDLSLGLKSSYKDFYEYVKTNKLHPENKIYKDIQAKPESWADFELRLGKYTKYIDKLEVRAKNRESIILHEELFEIVEDLAEYIIDQETEVDKLPMTYRLSSDGFYKDLPDGQKNRIQGLLREKQTSIRFITLNYTTTLEKILSDTTMLSFPSLTVYSPIHIHGMLSENLTLGVSDETQISAVLSGEERDDLIKPLLITSMNDSRLNNLNNTLETSNLLILYGTSIGLTDKYIWLRVLDWLYSRSQNYIIIHEYDFNYSSAARRHSRVQKQFIKTVQNKLLRHSNFTEDETNDLRNRIFVIHNSDKLFVPTKRKTKES